MERIIPPWNVWFIPALVIRLLIYVLVRLTYSVTAKGRENVPEEGPVLLIANHISYVDVMLLQLVYPRYIHFVAHEYLFRIWWLGWILRMMGVVEIAPQRPRRALRQVAAKLDEGKVVCIFPEGAVSRTGCLQRIKPGIRMITRESGVPVQPAFIDGIWGSIFTFKGYRFSGKRPLPYRHPIRVNIGKIIEPGENLLQEVRQALMDLGEEAFSERTSLDEHLGRRAVKALARRPWKRQIVDTSSERQELSRGKLLGMALAYSRRVRKSLPDKRIGIALPPGAGGTLANLAVLFAGKVPVNLPYTAAGCETAVQSVIALRAVEEQFRDFVWPENKVDLEEELSALGNVRRLLWVVAAWLLPGAWLCACIGIPRGGWRGQGGAFVYQGQCR